MPDRVGEDPLLGTKAGRFRLTELLGKGGMGRVYLGVHEELRSRVAIKILADEYAEDGTLVERFRTEALAASLVKHDGIARVLDLDRLSSGRPYIVMEYVEGKTLRQLLQANELTYDAALSAMEDVLGALQAAHDAGIIHRDLKPDNVIVTASGRAKILDFGIAKLLDRTALRTATGITLGTPQYMAPEQIRARPCDARTDIYAAGVMLFELITGQRPFTGDTDFEVMEQHLRAARPSAQALAAAVPGHIEAAIRTAMAIDPDVRYATAGAMAAALHPPLAPRRSRVPLVVLAVVTLVAVVMVVYALRGAGKPAPAATVAQVGPDAPVIALDAATQVVTITVDAAPVLVDAPPAAPKVAVRPRSPVHRCKTARDCPRYLCECALDTPYIALCGKDTCVGPAEACKDVCKSYGGGFTGTYRVQYAITDEDCRIQPECKTQGECKRRYDDSYGAYVCVTGCREVSQCRKDGWCSDGPDGSCIATSVEDCQKSEACKRAGTCTPKDGICVATDAACVASEDCEAAGMCRASADGRTCEVGSDAQCAASSLCASHGSCKAGPQRCVPENAEACTNAPMCKAAGYCTFTRSGCEISDAGCKASTECTKHGRCRLGYGGCIR